MKEEKDKDKNEEKKIEEYEVEQKQEIKQKIILIIIIIIILLLCLLSYRIGRIGYKEAFNLVAGEDIKVIEVTNDDIKATKNTELDIFKNVKFDDQKIIAPKSEGARKFYIKNITNKDIIYNINLAEEKRLPINMKYRLKMDNIYIRGDENTYVDINQLNIKDIVVLKDSANIFTLEWCWQDDDPVDTSIGSSKTDEYYTLKLNIKAFEKK